MGIIFLLVVLTNLAGAVLAQEIVPRRKEQIQMPSSPRVIVPPSRNPNQAEEDLSKKKQWMKGKIKESSPPEKTHDTITDEKLLKEMIKPRPFKHSFTVSMLVPTMLVSGPREGYSLEPSASFHWHYRLSSQQNRDKTQLWTGLRAAYFNGTGIYQETPGRFSFLYIGPTIGLGSFDLAPESLSKEAFDGTDPSDHFESISGWLLLGGICAQSREAKTSAGTEQPDDDINTKGITFDARVVGVNKGHIIFFSGYQATADSKGRWSFKGTSGANSKVTVLDKDHRVVLRTTITNHPTRAAAIAVPSREIAYRP